MRKWILLGLLALIPSLTGCEGCSQVEALKKPQAPSNLVAVAVSYNQIDLTWQDNSNNEDGFTVGCNIHGGNTYWEIADLPPDTTHFEHSQLSPSTTYKYYIYAYNKTGGASSNEASATTPTDQTIPIAPSNLTAIVICCNQVDLAWQDNSDNEDGLKIFRTFGGTTHYEIADLAVNVTSYSDTGLNANSAYWYYIQAYNSAGTANSNSASATTPPMVEILNHQLGEKYEDACVNGQGKSNWSDMIDWIEITVWWYDSSEVLLDTDWALISDVPSQTIFNFEVWGYNIPRNQVARYDIEVTDITIY